MGGQVISIYEGPDPKYCHDAYNIYKRDVERINNELIKRKLPSYRDNVIAHSTLISDNFTIELRHSEAASFRLLAAKFIENPDWIPPQDPKDYKQISNEEYQRLWCKSHIAGMPDVHGYYVPIYFQVLSCCSSPILGSSITFQAELRKMALKFNLAPLELDTYIDAPKMPDGIRIRELEKEAFGKEKSIILSLYAIATASIHYGRIIYLGE